MLVVLQEIGWKDHL